MFTQKTTLFGLAALLALGTFATAQGTGRGQKFDESRGRFERRAGFEKRAKLKKFVRELEITDAQRAQALAAAQTIAPIAQSARAEARTILENARKANPTGDRQAIRESVRAAMQSVKERAQGQVLPIARNVFDTLTPEQKDKLRAAAERHGRTFDSERAAQRMGRMLASPRAVEFLEARTGR
ncbi:MAG: Spy/CpxP family protein refolding chaperone [Planctomycetota bacterium]|nr:Spy/CpxP family protein refolding chaperone [Planctomycetota bacterium]